MRRTFVLPIDVYDPPTSAIVEQLNAVNAAHKRCGIIGIVARLVCAPDVSNVSELFGAPGNFLFVKSLLGKIRFHAGDETIYVQNLRRETVIRAGLCSRN